MKQINIVAFATMICTMTVGTVNRAAWAEQPQPVLRTFMIVYLDREFPDVFNAQSQFIVTHSGRNANGGTTPRERWTANCDCNCGLYLYNNTKWIFGSYITHVTTNGPRSYFVYWLDELPPSGAILYTGPDSLAIGESVGTRTASAGECDRTNGDWVISTTVEGPNSFPGYIVTGLFSR